MLRKDIFSDRTTVLKSVIHKLVYLASFSHRNIILNTSCATRFFITQSRQIVLLLIAVYL